MLEYFTPEFANTAEITQPAETLLNGGFQCGAANPNDFNWLFNNIYKELLRLDAETVSENALELGVIFQ